MTTFEETLKNHSSEIKHFDNFGDFCRKWGFEAELVEVQKGNGVFLLHDIGREVWRVTDKRSGDGMGFFAIDYTEEISGYSVSRRQTAPFRVKEIYEMKIVKRYERVE